MLNFNLVLHIYKHASKNGSCERWDEKEVDLASPAAAAAAAALLLSNK